MAGVGRAAPVVQGLASEGYYVTCRLLAAKAQKSEKRHLATVKRIQKGCGGNHTGSAEPQAELKPTDPEIVT